ncbi:MAG TPA: hypothetical protein VFB15_01315 [Candidatus Binataceae bacterium]|nr:hypothetical protein [Candidatus Binataceae bacterium]
MEAQGALGASIDAVRRTPQGRLSVWLAGCLAALVAFYLSGFRHPPGWGSLRTGCLTLAVFALAALYRVRKRWTWWDLRTMWFGARLPARLGGWWRRADRLETWRHVHIAAGLGVMIPLWWHIQEGAGASRLEIVLLAIVGLLLVSGVSGVLIQDFLPHAMRIRPGYEVRLEDIEGALHDLYVEAEEAILGRPEAFVQTYLRDIRPLMLGSPRSAALLWATLTGSDPTTAVTDRLAHRQPETSDPAAWERLTKLVERKLRLDHNRVNLRLSRGWVSAHLVLVVLLAVLVSFHIAGALYFAGL